MSEQAERIEIKQRWWSVRELSDWFGVSDKVVTIWISRGLLEGHKFGGVYRTSDEAVQRFLQRTRVAADRVRAGGEPGEFGTAIKAVAEHDDDGPAVDWSQLKIPDEAEVQS